jgi:excisionase family DNA binding protein
MAQTVTLEPLLDVDDASETLRISRRSVYRLIASGQLSVVKIGDRTLFERAAVRAFATPRPSGPFPASSQ